MWVARTAVALLAALILFGCEAKRQPGPPVPLKSFVLHDVQGLSGGHALWVSEDRTAFIQVVEHSPMGQSGLWEKRYKAKLSAEQWAEVKRLAGAHHLLTFKGPERPGVPDEAHPIIMLVTQSGVITKARKWDSDKHPDFDPVYDYLLGLCRAEGELVREGEFDWPWRPDGFAAPW